MILCDNFCSGSKQHDVPAIWSHESLCYPVLPFVTSYDNLRKTVVFSRSLTCLNLIVNASIYWYKIYFCKPAVFIQSNGCLHLISLHSWWEVYMTTRCLRLDGKAYFFSAAWCHLPCSTKLKTSRIQVPRIISNIHSLSYPISPIWHTTL